VFKSIQSNIHILLLLLVGFVLRFTISFTHSYSSDELSAINRLDFDGFYNIINNAVKTGDMHPAGVQFFEEFWVSLFGNSELALRFPFVLMGVLSIGLTYLIGKKYLSKNAGIIAATLLTVTYFPIIHSELARPYSPGLLFSLMTAWFWLKIVIDNSKKWQNIIGLGLSFALAMYTHYFAFMFIGFIGVTGLFYIKKDNLVPYLISGCIGVLLFLPHISVTIYHLSIDGGLQWLAKPEITWLFQFVFHALNESWLFTGILLSLTILVIYKTEFKLKHITKHTKNFALWFFGIFLIGYLFSYFSSPILKYPVMLFPLPFLFLVIGNFFTRASAKLISIVFGLLLVFGATSTLVEKELYGNTHFGVFKELAEPIVKWRTDLGKENISTYFNLSSPNYLNYYIKQLGDSLEFNQHLIEFDGDYKLRKELLHSDTDYLIIGYSQRLTLPQIFETCKEFYPIVIDHLTLNNCAVFLLAKQGVKKETNQVKLLSTIDFQNQIPSGWKLNKKRLLNSNYISDSTAIYGPDFVFKKSEIEVNYTYYLKVNVTALPSKNAQLTVALTAKRNGKYVLNNSGNKIWIGQNLEAMLENSETNSAYFTTTIPKEINASDDIQISLWNRNGTPVKLQSISIEVIENIWN
jgi:hypothetical protein